MYKYWPKNTRVHYLHGSYSRSSYRKSIHWSFCFSFEVLHHHGQTLNSLICIMNFMLILLPGVSFKCACDFTENKGNSEFDHVQLMVEVCCKTPFKNMFLYFFLPRKYSANFTFHLEYTKMHFDKSSSLKCCVSNGDGGGKVRHRWYQH